MKNDNCLKKNEKIYMIAYGKLIEKMKAQHKFS